MLPVVDPVPAPSSQLSTSSRWRSNGPPWKAMQVMQLNYWTCTVVECRALVSRSGAFDIIIVTSAEGTRPSWLLAPIYRMNFFSCMAPSNELLGLLSHWNRILIRRRHTKLIYSVVLYCSHASLFESMFLRRHAKYEASAKVWSECMRKKKEQGQKQIFKLKTS